jgi:hypothetical protein
MCAFRNFKEQQLSLAQDREFDVASGKFSDLEIRPGTDEKFYYFFDTKSRRLITDFLLRAGPQVDTMCNIVLIKKGGLFTPRLSLWKKDKRREKSDTLTEAEVVSEGRTVLIRARVSVADCHENFWKLVDFLRACKEVDTSDYGFRVAGSSESELIASLQGHDKMAILDAVRTYLGGQITEQDVQMLLNRRASLEYFKSLMENDAFFLKERTRLGKESEAVWQAFFEDNSWVFGYGLILVACEHFKREKLEQITTGSNVFTGAGKRGDSIMRTKGLIQTLLFAEIKKHDERLLEARPYREPDVYQGSRQLTGAVAQVQKTAHKALRDLQDLHREHDPGGRFLFEISTIRPRQIVIIGNLGSLFENGEVNVEKMTAFEMYRRSQQGVEIITYDELYQRARFIVESGECTSLA